NMKYIIFGILVAIFGISYSFSQPVYTPPAGIVVITGGTIDGTPIGQTTPASGSFTSLSSNAIATFAAASIGSSLSSPSWMTTSPMFNVPATTLTDTSGSGTIALRGADTIQQPTFAASSSETITAPSTL